MQILTRSQRLILSSRHCVGLSIRSWTNDAEASEYVDTPNYPPILDLSEKSVKDREKEAWHMKITKLGTYEQKLLELNMPKYYGYWSCLLNDQDYHLNGVPFLKFVTRTAVTHGLPGHYYREVEEAAAVAVEKMSPSVERCIAWHFHYNNCRSTHNTPSNNSNDDINNNIFLADIHQLLSSCLPYPTTAKTVKEPSINAWWFAGGLHNTGAERREWKHHEQKYRERKLMVRNLWFDEEEPYLGDHCFSSRSAPHLVVRESHGLPPVQDMILQDTELSALPEVQLLKEQAKVVERTKVEDVDEELEEDDSEPKLPSNRLHPQVYGYQFEHKPVCLKPGYSPGEARGFGRLFYHSRSSVTSHETTRGSLGAYNDAPEALRRAYLASIGDVDTTEDLGKTLEAQTGQPASLPMIHKLLVAAHTQGLSQAAILGFGPVTELTYPVVQQSVVTDGLHWTVALHQLNTVALHSQRTVDNPAINRLWVSECERLWEGIDPATGAVQGLNKRLLARLVTLYMKETKQRVKETPYLAYYKHLWQHPGLPLYVELFHKKMRTFFSDYTFGFRKPEIDAFELIYRLDKDTMPQLMNNKRFYEGFKDLLLPQDRTCKMYHPESIPRHSRPLGKNDPYKREPLLDSEHLFVPYYKTFKNKGYEGRYLRRIPYVHGNQYPV